MPRPSSAPYEVQRNFTLRPAEAWVRKRTEKTGALGNAFQKIRLTPYGSKS